MKNTKHATTNFRMILPFIDEVDNADGYRKFVSGEYMPFVVENLQYTFHGAEVYSIAHYGEQFGDLMADPEMTIAVDRIAGTVDPLSWQNDYAGIYQEVYVIGDTGEERYRPGLRTSLDSFLWQWLKNILDQGFDPANYKKD